MNVKRNSVIFISFFVFAGYYALLALLISLGLTNSSRLITIPLRLLISIFMLVILKDSFIKNKKLEAISLLFTLFWLFYFIKVLINYNSIHKLSRSWLEYIFYSVNFCILPFFALSRLNFNKYKKNILDTLIFSGFSMGAISLFLYKTILLSGVSRISMAKYSGIDDETLSPLALSYAGALTLTLCFYELIYNKNKRLSYSIYLYVTIILSLSMFFLGSSRGSVVAIVLTLPLFILYGSVKSKFKFFIFFLISIPLVIYGANLSGTSVFERTTSTINDGDFGRGQLWENAINEFLKYPFLGGRIEIGFYPHNFILEILMATGILGFLFLIIVLIKGFINVYKKSFLDSNYVWVFIILIQGITQHMFSGALYTAILVFFPLGLCFTANYNKDAE